MKFIVSIFLTLVFSLPALATDCPPEHSMVPETLLGRTIERMTINYDFSGLAESEAEIRQMKDPSQAPPRIETTKSVSMSMSSDLQVKEFFPGAEDRNDYVLKTEEDLSKFKSDIMMKYCKKQYEVSILGQPYLKGARVRSVVAVVNKVPEKQMAACVIEASTEIVVQCEPPDQNQSAN